MAVDKAGIDWMIVTGWRNKELGAVGFQGDTAAVIVAFYEDADGNQDGKVGWGEWTASKLSPLGLKNYAVTQVAMQARADPDIVMRDPELDQMAKQMFVKFAAGLVSDGIYAVYFSRGVSAIAKPIAGRLTTSFVKQFVLRKGMEKAVKSAYDGAMK